jgi:hypothetical protein
MGDYLQGASTVLAAQTEGVRIFGAHRTAPPGAPELATSDVEDLQSALRSIESGELEGTGFFPRVYRINTQLELYADPPWLQNWTPRHPNTAH